MVIEKELICRHRGYEICSVGNGLCIYRDGIFIERVDFMIVDSARHRIDMYCIGKFSVRFEVNSLGVDRR